MHLDKVQIRSPEHFPALQKSNRAQLRNVILGILNREDYLIEIGILMDITDDLISIFSKMSEEIRKVELGYVRLTTSGSEVGFL